MKKVVFGFLVLSVLLLGACSAEEAEDVKAESVPAKETDSVDEKTKSEGSESTEEAMDVDKGLFNVEVTLPASFFEGQDIEQAITDAEAAGVKEATKNEDGSVTYKMSKDTHKEMLSEMEASIQEYFTEMKTSEDFVSIKDVTANKDYSKFTLVVEQAAYEDSFDSFSTLGLGMLGMYYQVFEGVDAEKAKVEVEVEDEISGEIFSTSVFPDDIPE